MKAGESEGVLRKRLARLPEQLTPREAISAMCKFYVEERADGAALDQDGDMLLYQWGIDSFGKPESFQLGITRQFNVTGESQPYRLAYTFYYTPTDALRQIVFGNQWCPTPSDLTEFQKFIESSAGFTAVANAKPDRVELGLKHN